jgi:hypothetical protein
MIGATNARRGTSFSLSVATVTGIGIGLVTGGWRQWLTDRLEAEHQEGIPVEWPTHGELPEEVRGVLVALVRDRIPVSVDGPQRRLVQAHRDVNLPSTTVVNRIRGQRSEQVDQAENSESLLAHGVE